MLHADDPPKLGDLFTVQQAAAFLGVPPATLRNWDRMGKLKALRHPLNGYRLYRREQLQHLLRTVLTARPAPGQREQQ